MKFSGWTTVRFVWTFATLYCVMVLSGATPTFSSQVPVYFYDGAAVAGPTLAVAGDTFAVTGTSGSSFLVYVYKRVNGDWIESGRLSTPDAQ